jgi:hypothetical protein
MPRKDKVHESLRRALQKQQWRITHDPYKLVFRDQTVYIDLGAELLAAELDERKIAIEIKSFGRISAITDFHEALGQYMNYEMILEASEPERTLFLAVPVSAYVEFFASSYGQYAISHFKLHLIVFDEDLEEVKQWIN